MKNLPRYWWAYALLAAVIAYGMFLWALRYWEYQKVVAAIEAAQQRDDLRETEKKAWLQKLEQLKASKKRDLTLGEILATMPPEAAKKYALGFSMGMEKVNFYARIVDQRGNPISGVIVRHSIAGSLLGGYSSGTVISDEDGRIRISSNGAGITIMRVEKPGYYFLSQEPTGDLERWRFEDTDYFEAATAPSSVTKSWYQHDSSDKPYTFRLLKLEQVDGVFFGGVMAYIEPNGEWQDYRFLEDRNPAAPGAQMRFRATLVPYEERMGFSGWTVEIAPVDGGLVEAEDDPYMVLAPAEGYAPSFQYTRLPGSGGRHMDARRFYFRSNNGREYGSLVVKCLYLDEKLGLSCSGNYRLNVLGTRDLNSAKRDEMVRF